MESNNQIRFCSYCGTKLDDGARFCKGCGKAVVQTTQATSESNTKGEPSNEVFSHEPNTERTTVYEGKLHKCPNCGELLDAFRSHCPSCGYEIRDAHSSGSVRELAQKLERIEAEQMAPIEEKKSLMKMVFGKDFKEENEVEEAQERFDEHKRQQKANLIINFSVPNTREDILEFMILASSNIDVKKGIDDEVTKAWISKLDQVYEKAKLLLGSGPSFTQIKYIYDRKKAQIKNRKFKGLATACFIVGGYILLKEYKFLCENHIDSPQELVSFISEKREQIDVLEKERQSVYNRNRHKKSKEINAQAREITAQIKPLREELSVAKAVLAKIPKLKELLEIERQTENAVIYKTKERGYTR